MELTKEGPTTSLLFLQRIIYINLVASIHSITHAVTLNCPRVLIKPTHERDHQSIINQPISRLHLWGDPWNQYCTLGGKHVGESEYHSSTAHSLKYLFSITNIPATCNHKFCAKLHEPNAVLNFVLKTCQTNDVLPFHT